MTTDTYADLRDREELDDPLPEPTPPNCVTAYVVVTGGDGSHSVHTYDGHDLLLSRPPAVSDVMASMQALLFETQRQILVDSVVQALTPKPTPTTAAEVVAEALAKRSG